MSLVKETVKLFIPLAIILIILFFITSCADVHTYETPHSGSDGKNGTDGSSCSVEQLANGALITCTNGTSALVMNGVDGAPASNTFGIAGYIFPCGDQANNDEVFFRMSDGSIVALYDGGNLLARLVRLAPGNYVTTDSAGTCNISVDTQYNVTTSPQAATGLATGY